MSWMMIGLTIGRYNIKPQSRTIVNCYVGAAYIPITSIYLYGDGLAVEWISRLGR